VDIEYTDERLFVSLFKWGTETSLLMDLTAFPSTQHNFLETENRIEIEKPDFLLRIYPIDTRTTGDFYGDSEDVIQCHDGGLRFELVLKKKRPAAGNSFTFPIVAKNLRFAYQPFLTQKDIDAGKSCPINVEGSYAVYHLTKKNNQYMTGKAFHIYRPIAEDALGNKAWCSIEIDAPVDPTSLTLTIPQQFLDDATYPITIDPDFGYTSIGGAFYGIATYDECSRRGSTWTMPAPGGTANYLRAYLKESLAAEVCDVKAFINQQDSGGADIHGQIATQENDSCAVAPHWEEFTLADETLTEGVDYILNVMGNDADLTKGKVYSVAVDEDGALTVASYFEVQTYAAPESPWTDAPDPPEIRDYSIYCNYTETPAPPVEEGGLRMTLSLKGHMGYDLKTRGGKARRRMW